MRTIQTLSSLALIFLAMATFTASQVEALPLQQENANAEQESANPAEQESYEALMTQWNTLNTQLQELKTKAVTDEESAKEFSTLVGEANLLIQKLKDVILANNADGKMNKEMLRTLLGIMINDANSGRGNDVQKIGDQLVADGMSPAYFEAATTVDRLSIRGKELFEELAIRAREAKANDLPRVKLTTSQGEIVLELFENEAPNTVANFITLTKNKYYDGLDFHRVMEGFMAQGGCPDGNGSGGPGYNIKCECYSPEARNHFVGSLSMANTGIKDTGGSQFFITFERTSNLDNRHTVFGRVISGMDVLDKLTRTAMISPGQTEVKIPNAVPDKIVTAEVIRDRGHEYTVEKIESEKGDDGEKDDQ